MFEELDTHPVVVHSDEQLKRICEAKGLYSGHLENQTMRSTSKKKRPGYSRFVFNKRLGKVVRVA